MVYGELGGSRPGAHTCGVASTQIVRHNAHRKKLIISNDSGSTIYLSKGDSAAAVNTGIPLLSGGSWILEPDYKGYIWKGAIQCISLVAALNICWQEDW